MSIFSFITKPILNEIEIKISVVVFIILQVNEENRNRSKIYCFQSLNNTNDF